VGLIGTTIACESMVAADIEFGINAVLNDIVTALTKLLTSEEHSSQTKIEKLPRIAFAGNYRHGFDNCHNSRTTRRVGNVMIARSLA
jgi:hypothetical protein